MDCIQEVREKLQDVIWFILRHMNKIFMFSTSFILNIQRVTRHLHPSPSLCQVHVFSSVPSEGRSDSSAWRPLCALWTTFIFQLRRRRVHAPPPSARLLQPHLLHLHPARGIWRFGGMRRGTFKAPSGNVEADRRGIRRHCERDQSRRVNGIYRRLLCAAARV